ncbi:hypothetical protein [Sporomusa sp.]|uniref:hypothetical protein n=1 Tax=Sporomusa sp. TaxID=2078658 RepID=UPI002BFEAB25|nr:hypothetical protein [Sporomusa sp.]HWR42599.1 hypothetical protein [Sporomusa sp.]
MPTLGQHVGMYIISWLFWFVIVYFFSYMVQLRKGPVSDKKRLFWLANKIALFCTFASLAVNVVLRMRA